jgi:hypothetical protein
MVSRGAILPSVLGLGVVFTEFFADFVDLSAALGGNCYSGWVRADGHEVESVFVSFAVFEEETKEESD